MRTAPWRVAQLAQTGEEPVRRHDDAAVALDRLDDDGRDRSPTPDAGSSMAWRTSASAPAPASASRPSGQRYGYGIGQEVGIRRRSPTRLAEARLAVEPDDPARHGRSSRRRTR